MWQNGEVEWNGRTWVYEAKVFDRPSMWGIDNGRISKLYIYDKAKGGKVEWSYERGWGQQAAPPGLVNLIVELYPSNG